MPQTTTKFKVTLATLIAAITALGLSFNQAVLVKNQQTLDDRLTGLSKHIISLEQPTATPSATPTIGLKKAVSPVVVTIVPTKAK